MERRRKESDAVTKTVIGGLRSGVRGVLCGQRMRRWIEIEFCPFRARQRPRRLMTLDELLPGMPDLQSAPWAACPIRYFPPSENGRRTASEGRHRSWCRI